MYKLDTSQKPRRNPTQSISLYFSFIWLFFLICHKRNIVNLKYTGFNIDLYFSKCHLSFVQTLNYRRMYLNIKGQSKITKAKAGCTFHMKQATTLIGYMNESITFLIFNELTRLSLHIFRKYSEQQVEMKLVFGSRFIRWMVFLDKQIALVNGNLFLVSRYVVTQDSQITW